MPALASLLAIISWPESPSGRWMLPPVPPAVAAGRGARRPRLAGAATDAPLAPCFRGASGMTVRSIRICSAAGREARGVIGQVLEEPVGAARARRRVRVVQLRGNGDRVVPGCCCGRAEDSRRPASRSMPPIAPSAPRELRRLQLRAPWRASTSRHPHRATPSDPTDPRQDRRWAYATAWPRFTWPRSRPMRPP